jgi:hypothetical protein
VQGLSGWAALPYWNKWEAQLKELRKRAPPTAAHFELASDDWVSMFTEGTARAVPLSSSLYLSVAQCWL